MVPSVSFQLIFGIPSPLFIPAYLKIPTYNSVFSSVLVWNASEVLTKEKCKRSVVWRVGSCDSDEAHLVVGEYVYFWICAVQINLSEWTNDVVNRVIWVKKKRNWKSSDLCSVCLWSILKLECFIVSVPFYFLMNIAVPGEPTFGVGLSGISGNAHISCFIHDSVRKINK